MAVANPFTGGRVSISSVSGYSDCCSQPSVCPSGEGVCSACFDNLVCSVECTVPSTACPATSVDGGTCYYGSTSCCPCFVDASCGACSVPYGHCSYSGVTTTKQTSCPDKCEKVGNVPVLSKMVPAGSTANKCDKDSGWACDYTVTTDNVCCGDTDCAGLTCAGIIDPITKQDYGPRVKTCDLTEGSPTKYTCKCDPCRAGYSSTDCVTSCCDADIKGLQRGDCTPTNTVSTYNYAKWLCA